MTTAILLAIILALLIRLWYRNCHIETLNAAIYVLAESASEDSKKEAGLILGADLNFDEAKQ